MAYYKKREEHARINDKIPDESVINGLFSIVKTGDLDKIREFISRNNTVINLQQDGNTVIHVILTEDTVKQLKEDKIYTLIKYFIENDVQINSMDKFNRTALHLASKYHLFKVVKLLVENGANTDLPDDNGMLPLHYATIGFIKKCPDIKKIESIIHHDKNPNISKQIKKDIIKLIYNYLTNRNLLPEVQKLSMHIKNTLQNSINYDIEDQINNGISQFLDNVVNQLSTNIDNNEDLLRIHITNLYKHINDHLINKTHSKYFKTLDVRTYDNVENTFKIDGIGSIIHDTIPSKELIDLDVNFITNMEKHTDSFIDKIEDINVLLDIMIVRSHDITKNIEIMRSIIHKYDSYSVPVGAHMNQIDNLIEYDHNNHGIINHRHDYHLFISDPALVLVINNEQLNIKLSNMAQFQDNHVPPRPLPLVRLIEDANILITLKGGLLLKYKNTKDNFNNTINDGFVSTLLDLPGVPHRYNTTQMRQSTFFSVIESFTEYIKNYANRYIIEQVTNIKKCITNFKLGEFNGNINNIDFRYIYYNIVKIISNINRHYVKFIYVCLNELLDVNTNRAPKLKNEIINILNANQNTGIYKDIAIYGYDEMVSIFKNFSNDNDQYNGFIYNIILKVDSVIDTLNSIIDDINGYSGVRYFNYLINVSSNRNFVHIPKMYDGIFPKIIKSDDTYDFMNTYRTIDFNDVEKYYLKLIPSVDKDDDKIIYYEGGNALAQPQNFPKIPIDGRQLDNHPCYNNLHPITINVGLQYPNRNQTNHLNGKLYPIDNIVNQVIETWIVNPYVGPLFNINACQGVLQFPVLPPPGHANLIGNFPIAGLIGYNPSCYQLMKQNRPVKNIYPFIGKYLGIVKYHIIILILEHINNNIIQNIINNPCDITVNDDIKQYIELQPHPHTEYHITIAKILFELNKVYGQLSRPTLIKLLLSILSVSIDNLMITNGRSILHKTINKIIRTKLKEDYLDVNIPGINFTNIYSTITSNFDFKLDLNKIFSNTMNRVTQNIPNIGTFEYLRIDNIGVNDIENDNKLIVYDMDYDVTDTKVVKTCYYNKLDLISYLLQHTKDIYHMDTNNENPLIKSINTHCVEMVNNVLQYYPLSRIIENERISPIGHLIDAYNDHLKYITYESLYMYDNYIKKITHPFTNKIKKKILDEEIYKNNLFKYYDNVFPLFTLIYNLMLFNCSRNSTNISVDDTNRLINLFISNNLLTENKRNFQRIVPILEIDDETLTNVLEKGIDTHVISKGHSELNDELLRLENELEQQQLELQKLNDILNTLDPADPIDARYTVTLQQKIIDINGIPGIPAGKIVTLQNEVANIRNRLTRIDQNMLRKTQNDLGIIRVNIQHFRNPPIVGPLPPNIPDCVIRRFDQKAIEYYNCIGKLFMDNKFCYNELIKNYIQDNERLTNLENIHLLMISLQEKLLNELDHLVKDIRSNLLTVLSTELRTKFTNLLNEYYIMEKYYDTFKDMITSKNDKLYYFNDTDNPYLNDTLDIVIHTIDNTIGQFFLNIIMKLLYTYFNTNTVSVRDTMIKQTINGIIKASNFNSVMTIEKFLTDNELSRLFVKSVFNIQNNKDDDISNYTNPDKFVEILIGLLRDNVYHPFKEEDIIIKYINKDIYPFMKFIYHTVLGNMKQFIQKYDSYIMNDYQYIKMTISFINKILN